MPQISLLSQKTKNQRANLRSIKTIKFICLVTAFTSSCIAISVALLIPKSKQNSQFQFPQQITLQDWRSQSSNNLEEALKNGAIAAKRYTYTSSTQDDLRIDIQYIDRGVDVPKYLVMIGLKPVVNSVDQRYLEAIGHYVVFNNLERAYLSACINPRGGSTVTEEQFIQNRNTFDITPERLGLYLLGVIHLRDTRCLFVVMSIPLSDINSTTNPSLDLNQQRINGSKVTYQKLEKVWINWYKNWENKFPEI
jgi:cyanosortase A-associated protein